MKNQKGVSLITLIITIIVVIILAVIVLRSGASDTPDQAAFSGFTQEMGELQDAVKTAMLEAKADEILKGNQRTEAQLYNFIARGGYEGFEREREKVREKGASMCTAAWFDDDAKWLIQSHAESIKCTPIEEEYAEKLLGMKMPVRKVETAKGVDQKVSYFVTPKGIVFCWPPYVYDGKSYVNANTTVKSDTNFNDEGNLIIGSVEMDGVEATISKEVYTDYTDYDYIIAFENNEYVKVQNTDEFTSFYHISLQACEDVEHYVIIIDYDSLSTIKYTNENNVIGVDARCYSNAETRAFEEDGSPIPADF